MARAPDSETPNAQATNAQAVIAAALLELLERDQPCATATITASSGSIPNEVGAQIVVDARGERVAGTVGGGEIEFRTIAECKAAIAEGKHRSFRYHLTDEDAGGIGMMCGGRADIFVHVHKAAPQLVLVGAGHINLELARLMRPLGFSVTVIDDREAWANVESYPGAVVLNAQPAEGYESVRWRDDTYVVIGTRDRDLPALRALVGRRCCYIGVVASKRKALTLLAHLERDGVDIDAIAEQLYAPVGLATGGRTPADIALSIAAEIQMLRHGGSLAHLRVEPREHARLRERRSLKSG